MAEEEIEMTKDPFTNEVPKHTLYKVRKELLKSEQYKSLSSEDDWIARGPNDVGGRTRALLVDIRDTTHNTLFAGSVSGGLWKCTNAQIDPIWERVETYLGNPSICSIVQDPANPEIIYLGTGEGFFNGDAYRGDGIYKSSDGGVNWSRLSSTNHGNFFYNQKLVINDEGDLFVATRGNGVMRSTTGGESWTPVLNNTNQGFSDRAADIEIAPDGTIFASMGLFTQDGLYRSKDGGIDWEYIELGIDSFERIEIAVSKTDTNAVLILVQEMENNAVGFVMTSSDGGDTWEQKRVPEKASGAPMAEGQAWYDMSAAIDPNDSNVYYVGGVDLYKSVNGGEGWRIVSSWFGGGGYPYVHADQHSIHFLGNSSDKAYFTNDGGLWFTENATEPRPDFRDLSGGYITTQYYACAIHPEFGKDYYIGGSQDNGSELINGPGLSSSVGLTGGDGAYCHIDQLDPNIQITSSQRGNYNVTTVGNFSEREGYSNPGDAYFINPTDYDDFTKTLYTSHNSNQYFWFDVLTGERDSVIINELNGDRVTALLASPIDSTILYLGTNNGIILKVTNPRQPIANAEVLFRGPGFTRNIDVDLSDPDRLLCTYSNFAIQSVYLSENGGDNWRSLEGNLPNIPVRWGVFNPSFPEEIIIATEVGVWITSTINSSVEWENISGNLGLGRVNMLKFRQSDFQMLAASYGKGMFTTNMFAKKGLQFEEDKIAIEINGDIVNESCDPISTESVKIFTSFPFDQDVEITVEADTASTAQEGVDFIINEPTVILPAGETEYNFEISVFDNATIETNKKLILNMTSPEEVLKGSVEVTLLENDQFFSDGVTGIAVNIGDDDRQTSSIFKGSFEDSKTQLLYTRDV
ncbi:MAG: hypothetical protein HKO66_03090, partial [Saprospiraceae bacterium]|nr:hypothetical protein [Saprospiraceae bacterium]